MFFYTQALPLRQLYQYTINGMCKSPLRGEGGRRSLLAASVGLSILLVSCGKTEITKAPTSAISTPKGNPVVTDAQMDHAITQSLEPTPVERRDALADEAESILDKYPNKPATDLLNLPEVNENLKVALTKLGQDKGLQNKINSTVELAAKMKGLEGTPGSVGLDLDTKNYNRDQKSRMLQAVLSKDPKRIVSFLVEEIGEAAPELSYGGKDRASNGIAIKENQPPAK